MSVDKKMAEENTVSAKEQTNPTTAIFVFSIVIGVAIVIVVFTMYRKRRQHRQMDIRTVSGVFQAFLMRPAGSHLTQTDIRCEKGTDRDDVTNLLSGFDRGTFHDQTGNDDIEHSDLAFASPLGGRPPIPCGFHTEIVTADHPCIADIANDLCHDERVRVFFSRLGIQEARYIPQLEHWLRNDCDNIKYKQIMLDVLVHWCRKQGQNATLYTLTESLVTANLTNIAVDLIERYGNEGSACTMVNEIEMVFVSQEMAELKGLSQGSHCGNISDSIPVEFRDSADMNDLLDTAHSARCLNEFITVPFLQQCIGAEDHKESQGINTHFVDDFLEAKNLEENSPIAQGILDESLDAVT